ncbi:NPC intracellular cholesterol transporter 1-like [Glandiceps talaboti]
MARYWLFVVAVLCCFTNLQVTASYPYIHSEGYCMWYSECGISPETNKTVPCHYNGPAIRLEEPLGLGILAELCPQYYEEGNSYTCCDTLQLQTLQVSTAFIQTAFARCPACLENFMQLYCESTCSPDTSLFINNSRTYYDVETNLTMLLESDYFISKRNGYGSYYSCNEVLFPSTNSPVIGLMCGGYTAEECTPEAWLDYMGSPSNGITPFRLRYVMVENGTEIGHGVEPMDKPIIPCNDSPSNTTYACSCQDCTIACGAALDRPAEEEPWEIGGIDGVLFVMIMVFCCFVVVYIGLLIFYYTMVKDKNRSGDENKKLVVTEDDVNCVENAGYVMHKNMSEIFRRWGVFVTTNPIKVIVIALIAVTICACGNAFIIITVDPIDLWVSDDSRCLAEKNYYDEHFQPFWRVSQVIITAPNHNSSVYATWPNGVHENFGPVLDNEFLHQVLDLQEYLNYMPVWYEPDQEFFTLEDICYMAMEPEILKCVIQSPLQYYQNDHAKLDRVVYVDEMGNTLDYPADYRDHFQYCVKSPNTVQCTTPYADSCMGEYSGPNYAYTCLGGFEDSLYNNATAILVTFLNDNYVDNDEIIDKVKVWEAAFLDVVMAWNNTNMSMSYYAERSIEDELIRASQADIMTIVLSYVFIFCYITIALGEIYRCDKRLLIDSKVTLGLGGILLILCSVFASMGIYGYLGVETTLIIIEVVPFLLLAVGADMMFIFVLDYQRCERLEGESREEHIGRVLGNVGPSMILCSLSESVAFFLGALTTMPAVRTFALYAGLAVLFDFMLLISAFVGLMVLDIRRQEGGRFDICCCIPPKTKSNEQPEHKELLQGFMKKYYAPFLVNKWVRACMMILFVGFFCCCMVWMSNIQIGLDASLSMPRDSYVLDFFTDLGSYLSVGSPVYFVVVHGYNYSHISGQNKICGSAGCNQDSLTQQIYFAAQDPDFTTITLPAMSWIDDYFDWITPSISPVRPCCREFVRGPDVGEFCPADYEPFINCEPCLPTEDRGKRPTVLQFEEYLPWFLEDNPNLYCSKGGKAAYGPLVELYDNGTYAATAFMTYHTVLTTSQAITDGLLKARHIADNITTSLNADGGDFYVFPYSLTYVYYEQYLTMVDDTVYQLTIALIAIFVVSFLLLGFDILSTICIVLTITMIVIDTMGCMYLWNIDLNAVSLVNLVMAVGMSVEFISHITRYFAQCTSTSRVARAEKSVANVGSSILSGVAFTNLAGIIPLAFAKSQLFEIFYFRMFLLITLIGCAHGLMFQPILLIYLGPSVNKAKLLQEQQEIQSEDSESAYENMGMDTDEAVKGHALSSMDGHGGTNKI